MVISLHNDSNNTVDEAVREKTRVLHFGPQHCLGRINLVSNAAASTCNGAVGEMPAFGDVAVPAEARVHLQVSLTGACDLSPLLNLAPDDVEYIGFDRCEIDDFQFKHIANLSLLKVLNCQNTTLSEFGLAFIGTMKQLPFLNLAHTGVTDSALKKLTSMNLETLNLSNTDITDEGMEHIAEIQSLQHLILPVGVTDVGLKLISNLRLNSLTLNETRCTDAGLASLTSMLSLENLTLPPACTDDGLRSLMGLRLEILYVAGSQCSKAALAQARKDGITEFVV